MNRIESPLYSPLKRVKATLRAMRPGGPGFPFILSIAVFTGFFSLFLCGEGQASELALKDAYVMAMENHESVRVAGELSLQGREGVREAYAAFLPSVTASGELRKFSTEQSSASFLLQPDRTKRVDLVLTQSLYAGGKNLSNLRGSRMRAEATEALALATEDELLITTARVYFASLKAFSEVNIKEASLKRVSEQLRASRARLKAGTATRAVVLRAEAEKAGRAAELIKAEKVLIDAIDLLKSITGFEGELTLKDPDDITPPLEDISEIVKVAFSKRPDYRARLFSEKASKEDVGYARGGYLPTVTVEGGYTYRDQSPETTFFLNDSASAAIVVSYPLFDGGVRKARLNEAKSRRRAASLERSRYKKDLEVEVRRRYNEVETQGAVTEAFEKQLSFAGENYRMVFKRFTYGLADSTDLIDADSTLVEAESGLMNARYDYQLGILELSNSMGLLVSGLDPGNTP